MDGLEKYISWDVDEDSGFRRLVLNEFESPITEMEKFKEYTGDKKVCPICKRNLPKNTYFFASGGSKRYGGLHSYCKECEGTRFGWGRKKNAELYAENKKYCRTCDRILPLNELYFQKSDGRCNTKTGFSSNCKECQNHTFGTRSINAFKDDFGIRDGYKVCHNCMLEMPDTDDYFYHKSEREYGQTVCKSCIAKKAGRELTNSRHLNKSKVYMLKEGEKFCTSCGEIFREEDILRNGGVCLCDKCYRDRNKYTYEKRRSRKMNLISDLTQEEWNDTLRYFEHKCAYCGIEESECFGRHHKYLAQEHIVALTKGGHFTKNNIIPVCPVCNSSKGNKSLDAFYNRCDSFTTEMYKKVKDFVSANSC